jgi:hypothetical protein
MSTAKARAGQGALAKDPLMREAAALRRKLPQLLRTHPGEYVAFYEGRVAGHGPDDEELASRMFAKLGDVPFYIARVAEAPASCDVPSPEVVG